VGLFPGVSSAIVETVWTEMKRKLQPKPETVVPVEILEQAKRSISPDRLTAVAKCSVCGGETTLVCSEPLCWVCRRLKISAWREIEQQMPAQE
jgi:hypothetical protein